MFHVAGNLYRGPRPKRLRDLRERGITRVICLQSGTHNRFHDDQYERDWVTEPDSGIKIHTIDCSGIFPPAKHDVELFMKVIRSYYKSVPSIKDGKIYVHCMAGKDRTGFMIAVFRMQICNWFHSAAVEEMKRMGQHLRYRWWIPFLRKYQK